MVTVGESAKIGSTMHCTLRSLHMIEFPQYVNNSCLRSRHAYVLYIQVQVPLLGQIQKS